MSSVAVYCPVLRRADRRRPPEIVVEGLSGGDEVNRPTVVLTHLHGECALLRPARTADEEGEWHQ